MKLDSPEKQLRRHAARIGIQLADRTQPVSEVECCGHILPAPFVWFCANYPNHAGFPHGWWWKPPFGLLSPFGPQSPLQLRNAELRRDIANWPAHWVSFWHGNDGDFCFSFDRDGHPWIVYWHYNVEPADFGEDIEAVDFAEWFLQQVEWVIKQKTT